MNKEPTIDTAERVPREIWPLIELVLVNANRGTLEPEDIMLPSRRTTASPLLDQLERTLYADAVPATSRDGIADLRRQWAAFRIIRFFALDDGDQVVATIGTIIGPNPDAEMGWRPSAIIDALTAANLAPRAVAANAKHWSDAADRSSPRRSNARTGWTH